jgi:hypothetical protein
MNYGPKDDGTYVVEFRTAVARRCRVRCRARGSIAADPKLGSVLIRLMRAVSPSTTTLAQRKKPVSPSPVARVERLDCGRHFPGGTNPVRAAEAETSLRQVNDAIPQLKSRLRSVLIDQLYAQHLDPG